MQITPTQSLTGAYSQFFHLIRASFRPCNPHRELLIQQPPPYCLCLPASCQIILHFRAPNLVKILRHLPLPGIRILRKAPHRLVQALHIVFIPTHHMHYSRSLILQCAMDAENATINIQRRPLLFHALCDGNVGVLLFIWAAGVEVKVLWPRFSRKVVSAWERPRVRIKVSLLGLEL